MAWVAALVGAAYQGYNTHAKNKKAKAANRRNAMLFANNEPDYVGNAMRGGYTGNNQYQKDLTAIAQGTYLDPRVMAAPIAEINRGADQNMQNVAAQIGRSNMSGGLTNAYALVNQQGAQMNRANLKQNYGMWREAQRRKDLDWIKGMRDTDMARQQGLKNQIADRYQETGSPLGDAVGSFIGSYAGSTNQGNFFANPFGGGGKSGIQAGGVPNQDPYKNFYDPQDYQSNVGPYQSPGQWWKPYKS